MSIAEMEPQASETPRLNLKIIKLTLKKLSAQSVYTEPAGSREAFARADRVSPYDLSSALYDVLVPRGQEVPGNFAQLRDELEASLADDEEVQRLLAAHRTEADRLNQESRAA